MAKKVDLSKIQGAVTISESIDMEELLERIPRSIMKKSEGSREAAGQKAVKAATEIVAAAYRERVPVGETGNLKRSIDTKVVAYGDGQIWFGVAGARRRRNGKKTERGHHAHLIELGHAVVPRGRAGEGQGRKRRISRMKNNLMDLFKVTNQAAVLTQRISELESKRKRPKTGKARVEGKYDLVAAIDTTQPQQDKAIIDSLMKSIKAVGG